MNISKLVGIIEDEFPNFEIFANDMGYIHVYHEYREAYIEDVYMDNLLFQLRNEDLYLVNENNINVNKQNNEFEYIQYKINAECISELLNLWRTECLGKNNLLRSILPNYPKLYEVSKTGLVMDVVKSMFPELEIVIDYDRANFNEVIEIEFYNKCALSFTIIDDDICITKEIVYTSLGLIKDTVTCNIRIDSCIIPQIINTWLKRGKCSSLENAWLKNLLEQNYAPTKNARNI